MKRRIAFWDNLKGILILLVVLGHLLEKLPGGRDSAVYKMIYLFHMPLFVFCSGFLASFSPGKIIRRLLLPYLIFQAVGCIGNGQPLQLHTPVWILWYLPALAAWQCTIPLLDRIPQRLRPAAIPACILCACIAGFVPQIGYPAALSRIIVFYPYFAAGYLFKPQLRKFAERAPAKLRPAAIAILLACACVFIAAAPYIRPEWLYEADSYRAAGSSWAFRALHYLLAPLPALSVMLLTPRRISRIGAWGRCTLPVYLTHIALVPAAENLPAITASQMLQSVLCLVFSIGWCALIARIYPPLTARLQKAIAERKVQA